MKNEIMMRILFDLLSKKVVTASYLSKKYEVCVRSIYRYIETLEQAGVPIYTTRGHDGGFSIVDTYRLSSTFMTTEEFEQVIGTLSAVASSVPDKTLISAIDKLKATIKNEYSSLDVQSGNLIIDAGHWGDTRSYKGKLKTIETCIEKCKQLYIKYHDRNGETTERVIEPHLILFKQGLWYVYAYCNLRKEFRFFKTGRIEQATVLESKFIRQNLKKKDLPLDWHNTTASKKVKLLIDKSVLSDIEEWLGIENIEEIDGKHYANISLPIDDGLVSKIMSFNKGIKVLSPKELVDKIKTTAKDIIDLYK